MTFTNEGTFIPFWCSFISDGIEVKECEFWAGQTSVEFRFESSADPGAIAFYPQDGKEERILVMYIYQFAQTTVLTIKKVNFESNYGFEKRLKRIVSTAPLWGINYCKNETSLFIVMYWFKFDPNHGESHGAICTLCSECSRLEV